MNFVFDNLLLIMFLPVWVALILLLNTTTGFTESKKMTAGLTIASTSVGLCFALLGMYFALTGDTPSLEDNVLWFSSGSLNLYFGFLFDKISALFLLVLMSVSFAVQIFSYGYMKDDENFSRYFIYLNLFNFSMSGLILSSNLVQTYIFWELVGFCSYLLIGFWLSKKSASKAAQKAFIVNRIGDTALLVGVVSLIYFSLNYLNITGTEFLAFSNMQNFAEQLLPLTGDVAFYCICALILCGAIAKSAQFPLHVWLADAMEAPTPVSGLIHAATMVAAGIFLILRMYPLFILSAPLMNTILYVGLFTAFITAFFALCQNDIKKMLAHSTSSQLGLMFVALGILAPSAALFHFSMHAFYKALLFLAAGIVIKYLKDTQDMRKMGGLRKEMPLCAISYLIGSVCLSGLMFSGFFSKEAMAYAVSTEASMGVYATFVVISLMTAFYIFKSYFLIFEGEVRNTIQPIKTPVSMKTGLVLLAVPSLLLGFFVHKGFLDFINPLGMKNCSSIPFSITLASSLVALLGLGIAFLVVKKELYNDFLPRWLYKLSSKTFYINEIYSFFIKKVFNNFCKLINFLDKYIIDGAVRLVALLTRGFGWLVSKLQNGNVQSYLAYSVFFIGVLFMTVLVFYFILLRG
ncbi:MAG: NADH-quinone oxidoreductase subunit L [Candidatus Gastranaerophilales bacterium]|nr:NADH-quinone oxidoreductase subunit L [Candidatus Gastranaerophilales bacterium]